MLSGVGVGVAHRVNRRDILVVLKVEFQHLPVPVSVSLIGTYVLHHAYLRSEFRLVLGRANDSDLGLGEEGALQLFGARHCVRSGKGRGGRFKGLSWPLSHRTVLTYIPFR